MSTGQFAALTFAVMIGLGCGGPGSSNEDAGSRAGCSTTGHGGAEPRLLTASEDDAAGELYKSQEVLG